MGRWGDGDGGCHGNLPLAASPGREQSPRPARRGSIWVRGVNNHRMERGFVEGKMGSMVRESLLSASSRPWLLPSIVTFPCPPALNSPSSPRSARVCSSFLPVLRETCSNASPSSLSPPLAFLPFPRQTQKQFFLFGAANWGI